MSRNCVLWFLGMFFLYGCQSQSSEFVITQTEQAQIQETAVVQVDNCDSWLPTTETYRYPYAGETVGVENLIANGGEPFTSIRKHIWDMYGEPVNELTLSVPAQTDEPQTVADDLVSPPIVRVGEEDPVSNAINNVPAQNSSSLGETTQPPWSQTMLIQRP